MSLRRNLLADGKVRQVKRFLKIKMQIKNIIELREICNHRRKSEEVSQPLY